MSNYYDKNAKEFIESTINCDVTELYSFFEKYLPKRGRILDVGFGSGRDSLYFSSKGYEVFSIDPEPKFIEHAKKIGLKNVLEAKVEDIQFKDMFDGVWACASLLHVPSKVLPSVLTKCARALKKDGIMYVSFKYGDFEGVRNGRFFLDLTENSLNTIISKVGLVVLDMFVTNDVRPDKNEKWVNAIIGK